MLAPTTASECRRTIAPARHAGLDQAAACLLDRRADTRVEFVARQPRRQRIEKLHHQLPG